MLELGVSPQRIIFANAVKFRRDLKFARDNGVRKMTFDSIDEVKKIAEVGATSMHKPHRKNQII